MSDELIFCHDTNCYVDSVPTDGWCCVVLAGYKSVSPDRANIDEKRLRRFIKTSGLDTRIYSVIYKPAKNTAIMDFFKHIIVSSKTRYDLKYNVVGKIPFLIQALRHMEFDKYADKIFEKTVLPRLIDKNGNKLPVNQAKQNVRKITIFSHCYGGYVAKHLLQAMTKRLKKLKYSDEDAKQIMRQMVLISQSPIYVYNNPDYSVLNFVSASDTSVHYTTFFPTTDLVRFFNEYNLIMSESIIKNHKTIKRRTHKDIEHVLWPMKNTSYLSESGKYVIFLLKTVLYNAFTLRELSDIDSLFVSNGEKLNDKTSVEIFEWLKKDSHDFCKPKPRYDTFRIFTQSVINKFFSNQR